ncbi:hypothetical protein [Paenibacillus antarcticus]|uniref:Rho termination factor N-terminal domain-containing protein n=1 Tax=Paenibacillus antarcticus TaxID=253703 RepID=A0A168PA02_9BACL|nr:hypothetical protein [Paenibacillus antarcticus]OAB46549.1 hypothetical protein PBAT_11065 [Paenibacillus antarcticus]
MGLSSFNRARRLAAEKALEESQEKPLDKMSVAELKENAAENEIDLGDATKKPEIIALILAASGGGGDGDS